MITPALVFLPVWWQVGGNATLTTQVNTPVPGAYSNPDMSFGPDPHVGHSIVISLFGAVRVVRGVTILVSPEYAEGQGMPNPTGIAGYPDGDMVRAGAQGAYLARALVHVAIPIGPPADPPAAAALDERFTPDGLTQLAGATATTVVTIDAGKLAANDFFDASDLASDPRHHFLNWALMADGAYDFAADVRGYTAGIVVGIDAPRFALRGGLLMMPSVANGETLDDDLAHAREEVVEGELKWGGRFAGSAKLLGYLNHARAGNYEESFRTTPPGDKPDVTATRQPGRIKGGVSLLVEIPHAFLRAGWNDGQTETFAWTEIDRSLSGGTDISLGRFGRAGAGVALGWLSDVHARYLAAGGKGFQLGDGALDASVETIFEAYWQIDVARYFQITADAQLVVNPGMNADRGPVGVFGLRLHAHY